MKEELTTQQIERLRTLPPDYRIIAARRRFPMVRRPDGQRLLVEPNGTLAAYPLVERVQSYLSVEGG